MKTAGIIYLQVAPESINDLNRIFEGYEHIAMVSTMDKVQGIVRLLGTPDTEPIMELIFQHLPFPAKKLPDYEE